MIVFTQGESFPVSVGLRSKQTGGELTPDQVADLALCVGEIEKRYSTGTLRFDTEKGKYVFHPSQEETKKLKPGFYTLWVSIENTNGHVRKFKGPWVQIRAYDLRGK